MKSRHLKAGLAATVLIVVGGYLGLVLYSLTVMPVTELILCSSGEGGIRIPSSLCEYYMKHYRGNAKDMQDLAVGGLDPILNGESKKKYEIAAFFIAKGLDVNGINHYYYRKPDDLTPLHASVLYNDVERAKFLIDHGANPNIQSKTYNDMTPLEMAKAIQSKRPNEDRSALIRFLSNATSTSTPAR